MGPIWGVSNRNGTVCNFWGLAIQNACFGSVSYNDPWFKEPKDPFLQTEESGDDDCLRFTQTLVAETVQSVGLDEPGVMLCRFADGGC